MFGEEDRAERAAVENPKSKLPLTQQDKMLAELHEVINMLTDRLAPILVPAEESAMKEPGDRAPEPPKSEMKRRLDDHNSQIRKATHKVNSIIERLEI